MNFTTELEPKDVTIIGTGDWTSSDVTVKWSLDFDLRSQGINGFIVTIDGVDGELGNLDDPHTDMIDIRQADFWLKGYLKSNES